MGKSNREVLIYGDLYVCSDGSHSYSTRLGSHAWVFSTAAGEVLWCGAGPTIGHVTMRSPSRSELSGVTSLLLLLLWICKDQNILSGHVTLFCDSNKSLRYVFDDALKSPLDQVKPDMDLILSAKDILHLLPITVKHEWVKGHYRGPDRAPQHEINELADDVAKDYNYQCRRPILLDINEILSPCKEVALQSKEVVITSNLKKVVEESINTAPLIAKILKDTVWSESTFHSVDWDSHEKAIMNKSRFERISIVKLIHGLYQTNERNNKYYRTTDKYPICQDKTETLSHVLTCKDPLMIEYRVTQLEDLKASLIKIKTPELIIETVLYGIKHWTAQEDGDDKKVKAPSAGSVKPAEILLTQAFAEQQDSIGWEQMLRGRISKKWRAAYHAFKSTRISPETDQVKWGSKLIMLLWEYTRSLWKYRNGVIYGHSQEEARNKEMQSLRREVAEEYAKYIADNFLISSQFRYLFTKKSLEERQAMDYEGIKSWLRTVKEVKKEQQMFRERLSKAAAKFFVPRKSTNRSTQNRVGSNARSPGEGETDRQSPAIARSGEYTDQGARDPVLPSSVPPDPPWPP
jgi:hypothetical protein